LAGSSGLFSVNSGKGRLRQVFAVLALPSGDLDDFVGTVEARTFWRTYDSKKKTVGDQIKGSDIRQQLDD